MIITEGRYILKEDGSIYDKQDHRTLTLSEIVKMLNQHNTSEWNKFVNGGH